VARALDKKFDQQYTYDGLNRLTDAKTGLLNGSHIIPPGSDTRFQQQWSLDYVGNWSAFNQDDDGDGTFDLEQTRTANPVNEITNIAATIGPTWTTPQYDPAGNTTSFPKPAAPTESFTAIYDAWNRMVRVIDNETDNIVQENIYDGRNFRVIKKTYASGVLDETRHIYYTSSWQAIEERLGTDPDSADAAQQYVWGIRYIDDLVLRDRDTSEPPDGTLDERLYAIQDPNWNVTTIIDDSGDVQERYEYEVYGSVATYDGSYSTAFPSPAYAVLYTGQLRDSHTQMYLMRNRIYDPCQGCFAQREPTAYLDGLSLYCAYFVLRLQVDPFGLQVSEGDNDASAPIVGTMSAPGKNDIEDVWGRTRAKPSISVECGPAPDDASKFCAKEITLIVDTEIVIAVSFYMPDGNKQIGLKLYNRTERAMLHTYEHEVKHVESLEVGAQESVDAQFREKKVAYPTKANCETYVGLAALALFSKYVAKEKKHKNDASPKDDPHSREDEVSGTWNDRNFGAAVEAGTYDARTKTPAYNANTPAPKLSRLPGFAGKRLGNAVRGKWPNGG